MPCARRSPVEAADAEDKSTEQFAIGELELGKRDWGFDWGSGLADGELRLENGDWALDWRLAGTGCPYASTPQNQKFK